MTEGEGAESAVEKLPYDLTGIELTPEERAYLEDAADRYQRAQERPWTPVEWRSAWRRDAGLLKLLEARLPFPHVTNAHLRHLFAMFLAFWEGETLLRDVRAELAAVAYLERSNREVLVALVFWAGRMRSLLACPTY